ncbi:MAG: FAD-dependent oxidoreductase [bacterium]|nr:FAD-dependent oxidoreductase [bacterium]
MTAPSDSLGIQIPEPRFATGMLPERAQVVVVGGGIVGCSIAYHLARRGVTDVLLLEQNTLTGGTTWHAAGLVSQLKSSHSLTNLATYTTRLFEELEDDTGQATGYRTTGSISVASDEQRWEEILRGMSMARTAGVEMEVIDLEKAREMWPLLRIDDLVGTVYIPQDGQTSPVDTTMALAKGARDRGVTIREGIAVERVRIRDETVIGVETEAGFVEAETVVLACGIWTRQLAASAGVNVPLHPCEHFYVVTEPLDGMLPGMPTLRDPTNYTYFKEETGKLMAGFFEPQAKTWRYDVPRDFSFGALGEDWDHIGPIFERSIHRIPALAEAGIQLFFNGPEAFTPDGVYYLGESPEVDSLFVAAGFNSVGIQSAGGAGWVLADWIADRRPPMDLSAVDLRRAFPFQGEKSYLEERISESLGLLYAMHWPFRQFESARDVFRSVLHDRLADVGAVYGEVAGWERPNWFAIGDMEREYRYSYGKQNWYAASAVECEATRRRVALYDQSSFAKFMVTGPDAVTVLNRIGSADVDAPIGKVCYTQWLNDRGGIEADLTVTRTGIAEFMVVTGAAVANRDFHTLRKALRGHDAGLTDITMELPTIGVMGPRSRALLSALTDTPLDNASFPFGWSREITVAGIPVRALRVSYVGELGWELYVAREAAVDLFDAVMAEGESHGIHPAGYHAMNTLRLEAGYRHWGHDITDEDTPIEAGLAFTIAWDKEGGFLGRQALLAQRAAGVPPKRLAQFKLEDPEAIVYHDEPIRRNGVLVGRTTSGMYGHTFGTCLAMGYVLRDKGVTREWIESGTWDIEVAGVPVPATARLRPFYAAKIRS